MMNYLHVNLSQKKSKGALDFNPVPNFCLLIIRFMNQLCYLSIIMLIFILLFWIRAKKERREWKEGSCIVVIIVHFVAFVLFDLVNIFIPVNLSSWHTSNLFNYYNIEFGLGLRLPSHARWASGPTTFRAQSILLQANIMYDGLSPYKPIISSSKSSETFIPKQILLIN